MKLNTKSICLAEVLVAVILFGCNQNKTNDRGIIQTKLPVKLMTVTAEKSSEPRQYIGTIVESQSLSLSFPVSGNVAQVFVNEGWKVKKGRVLAILHSENSQNVLNAAKAKEKQAQDAYDRLSSVYKNGSLPDVKMVEVETGLQQAKSSSQIAEKNLQDCTLNAPTDGIIGKRSIEPGMNVLPDMEVFKIVKTEKVFAKISVSESEIAHINIGQRADVGIGALNNLNVSGKVEEKGVVADPLSRTYVVKITIDNKKSEIYPGMACTVQMEDSSQMSTIVIPQYCVLNGVDGEKYVYVADENNSRAVKRTVEVGTLFKKGVIITDGLRDGESIVTEGYQKLSDGSMIIVR